MKTAEDYIKAFAFSEYTDEDGDYCVKMVLSSAVDALKQYTEQEVRKHLELAAEKALISIERNHPEKHSLDVKSYSFFEKNGNEDIFSINKQSITGIEIKLT